MKKHMNARTRWIIATFTTCCAITASADIPDMLSSFEMGGRGLGMGGAIYSNASDTSASYWNPAGLGHIDQSQAEVDFRNRPSNNTTLTGNFTNPEESTSGQFGRNQFSFVGVAVPLGHGTLGLSYALGGYARELRRGTGLIVDESKGITADVDTRDAVSDEFITLAYGMKRGANMTMGAGIVFARETIMNATQIQLFQNGDPIPSPDPTDDNESANGVGGIVGVQFQPGGNANTSFGISLRSPIKLSGFDIFDSYSDTIPARLQAGMIFRKDGLRGGRDYLIGGIDAAYYFKANEGKALERIGHVSGGIGFEYNLAQTWGFVPIRLGVRSTQRGGSGFTQRNVITFGLGYRPSAGRFWVDLAGTAGSGSARPDFAISIGTLLGRK
ncbi:MAG TPA: hypothetical protein VFG65_05110 [Fimbriimonadales bacterium]|jgi:hypothetical protein|nr:hypothetical protein [Fimbriimonadales bacterium]